MPLSGAVVLFGAWLFGQRGTRLSNGHLSQDQGERQMPASSKETGLTGKRRIGAAIRQGLDQFFRKDESGATAVEFALIAVPFILTIFLSLFFGYIYVMTISLDDAINEVGRQIRVGKIEEDKVTKTGFKALVCDEVVFSKDNCLSNLVLDVHSAPDLKDVSQDKPFTDGLPDQTKEKYDPGEGSDYVIVSAYLPATEYITLLNSFTSLANKELVLTARTVFRNEPF